MGIEVQLSTGVHRHRGGAVLNSLPSSGGGLCMSLDLTGESVRAQLPMWGEWGGGGRSAPYLALLKPRGWEKRSFSFPVSQREAVLPKRFSADRLLFSYSFG